MWSGWLQLTGAGPKQKLGKTIPQFLAVLCAKRNKKKHEQKKKKKKKKRKKKKARKKENNNNNNKINDDNRAEAYPLTRT